MKKKREQKKKERKQRVKAFGEDFKKFISRGNVVDMAIGVAVASAFTAIVTAFTKGFITPLLALIAGQSNLDELKWIIREQIVENGVEVQPEVAFLWGGFVQAILNFLIIAFTLFMVMRIVKNVTVRATRMAAELKLKADQELAAERKAAEEAEAAAKAEAEAAAAAEAQRAAELQAAAEAKEKEEYERRLEELALLREIRDSLKK